ncbi:flavin-containing monooxygenase [Nitratireductor rhodophyticola]|uniref:flavin-containing monooxygenase n=1 Tax=Nitratireductor rhodophyticola TaxID=2854036 RepID=UPI0008141DEE
MSKFVLVIGAGQAGLATGYHLRESGLPFQIVDAGSRVGDSWRNRYASLTLFTPRQFSALPGLLLAGNRELYPSRDEFADYLQSYAALFDLPIRLDSGVVRLVKEAAGGFEAQLQNGERIRATHVVIATGAFQKPIIPSTASEFAPGIVQLTSDSYREPSQVPPGPVLVVGDGATGRDIAAELSAGHPTFLSAGKPRKLFPERILGKSVWWWLYWSGLMKASKESRAGRYMEKADPFPDRNRNLDSLSRNGVRIMPRLTSAAGSIAQFSDGSATEVVSVVWAVGYRDDSSWVEIASASDSSGSFVHTEGVSDVPNLFFVGRPWQRNRASALIMGAGPDAAVIVKRIAS